MRRISERNRRALATGALVAAVTGTLVVATLVSRQFFEGTTRSRLPHRPPAVTQRGASDSPVTLFRVATIEGQVEAFHNGQWYVVQAGDLLPLQDLIRTPKGSRAILRRGGSEVEVLENVDIQLLELASETSARFDLIRGGGVVTSVEDQNERVEISAAGTRAVNKGIARYVAKREGDLVTVATAKGEVDFSAHGKRVTVRAGSESTARPGRPPDDPQAIPEELLLSVIWPKLERSESQAQVAGKVRPSSRVKVNGVAAQIRPDGRFASSVPLAVGANQVKVEAEDILGRKKTVNKTIKRPPPMPTLEPTDEDLWKR